MVIVAACYGIELSISKGSIYSVGILLGGCQYTTNVKSVVIQCCISIKSVCPKYVNEVEVVKQ